MIALSDDELKSVLSLGAVLFCLSGAGGYTAGRMTAPEPAPVVVRIPIKQPVYRTVFVERKPEPPAPAPVVDPPPPTDADKTAGMPTRKPPIAATQSSKAPPKAVAKPKTKPKDQPPARKRGERRPARQVSCAYVRSEYNRIMALPILERGIEAARKMRGLTQAQIAETRRRCGI